MITYLSAHNYKSFVNFRVDFNGTTILIGRNGCGKSSVYEALILLKHFILGRGRTTDFFLPTFQTRWMKTRIQTFDLGIKVKEDLYEYHLEVEHEEETGNCLILKEQVKLNNKEIYTSNMGNAVFLDSETERQSAFMVERSFSGISYIANGLSQKKLGRFVQEVEKIVLCQIKPDKMKDAVAIEMPTPDVQFTNVGEVISFLSQTRPDVMTNLWGQLKEIDHSFERLRIEMGAFGKHLVADYRYKDQFVTFKFTELSEGERMLIVLYVLLYGYLQNGFTVFIDEPDNYVSLRELQPWCQAVEKACQYNGGQCIMISHHPEMIDYFAGSSGIWMTRKASGESSIMAAPHVDSSFMKYSELIAGGYLDEV